MTGLRSTVLLLAMAVSAAAATTFTVDPTAGRNQFTAVFDAAVGERIVAVSSQVGCTLVVDEDRLAASATCSVPLEAIRIDNDDVKSDHFRQWATNRKSNPAACRIELRLPEVRVPGTVEAGKPVTLQTDGTFTICGRLRDDRGAEAIKATVTYLPPTGAGDPACSASGPTSRPSTASATA